MRLRFDGRRCLLLRLVGLKACDQLVGLARHCIKVAPVADDIAIGSLDFIGLDHVVDDALLHRVELLELGRELDELLGRSVLLKQPVSLCDGCSLELGVNILVECVAPLLSLSPAVEGPVSATAVRLVRVDELHRTGILIPLVQLGDADFLDLLLLEVLTNVLQCLSAELVYEALLISAVVNVLSRSCRSSRLSLSSIVIQDLRLLSCI